MVIVVTRAHSVMGVTLVIKTAAVVTPITITCTIIVLSIDTIIITFIIILKDKFMLIVSDTKDAVVMQVRVITLL